MASKYDSIWLALKLKGEVKIAVPPPLQKRVIKGVIHCKDNDLARKLEMTEKRKKEKLSYTRESAMVTIKLNQHVNLKGIQPTEL